MTKLITRDEAVRLAGEELVLLVDSERCDFTGRCTQDDSVEFSAVVEFEDEDGFHRTLHAYYYQDSEAVSQCGDLGSLNWDIQGYAIN